MLPYLTPNVNTFLKIFIYFFDVFFFTNRLSDSFASVRNLFEPFEKKQTKDLPF